MNSKTTQPAASGKTVHTPRVVGVTPGRMAALDSIARHVEMAIGEALGLLTQRETMPAGAVLALNEMLARLQDCADDERADHCSGLMCEVVETLKEHDRDRDERGRLEVQG